VSFESRVPSVELEPQFLFAWRAGLGRLRTSLSFIQSSLPAIFSLFDLLRRGARRFFPRKIFLICQKLPAR
jgi:hypothetical protein